jgi:hypothetical protein
MCIASPRTPFTYIISCTVVSHLWTSDVVALVGLTPAPPSSPTGDPVAGANPAAPGGQLLTLVAVQTFGEVSLVTQPFTPGTVRPECLYPW